MVVLDGCQILKNSIEIIISQCYNFIVTKLVFEMILIHLSIQENYHNSLLLMFGLKLKDQDYII